MSLYWSISASFGLVQNISLKFPRVRRILGIPKTPLESRTPFRDIVAIIASRAAKFVEIQKEKETKDR